MNHQMLNRNTEMGMDVKVFEHLALLGKKVRDRVTGFTGVVAAIDFDLYGCIQATVTPAVKEDGDQLDSRWFDVSRLEVKSKKPVMPPPNFVNGDVADGKHGPAEKPAMRRGL